MSLVWTLQMGIQRLASFSANSRHFMLVYINDDDIRGCGECVDEGPVIVRVGLDWQHGALPQQGIDSGPSVVRHV